MEQLMRHSEEGGGGAVAALIYEKDVLRNFRQYGVWDAQRIGGKQHKTFQDYSTIAIGIYAAAAGIPRTSNSHHPGLLCMAAQLILAWHRLRPHVQALARR